jgi:pyruvate kinase
MGRQTKVIVTLGPATRGVRALAAMKARGVDFVRSNMSHSSIAELQESLAAARGVGIPFIIDTEGSQVRTGDVENGIIRFEENAEVRLWNTPVVGNDRELCLRPPSTLEQLEEGDLLHIDFDTLILRVVDVSTAGRGYVAARAVTGGFVGRNKAVVIDPVLSRRLEVPALSDKDLETIRIGLQAGVGQIAVSFVRSGSAVDEVRAVTEGRMSIISKVECVEALDRLEEIIDRSDALLLDRGDLSKEIPVERIPFVQKIVIHKARQQDKGVYVATNLLETMIERRRPTRAEIQDVVNTVLDGAAGLTLAAETAIGKHPIECINMLNRLIEHAESVVGNAGSGGCAGAFVPKLADSGYLVETGGWSSLPRPHGGRLIDRVVERSPQQAGVGALPVITLNRRQLMELELIANGTYSPLEGFMGPQDLESILAGMELADGTVWPLPILLDVSEGEARKLEAGQTVALADDQGRAIGLMELTDVFAWDRRRVAERVHGTADERHPGVQRTLAAGPMLLAGPVRQFARRSSETHAYELTPRQTRRLFVERGWQRILGDACGTLDERHARLQREALDHASCDGLFIQALVGDACPRGLRPVDLVRDCERAVQRYHPRETVLVAGLATQQRHAGPREVLLAALCRMNFGCSHFLFTGDPAVREQCADLGIEPVSAACASATDA